jgi:hypothetical protein
MAATATRSRTRSKSSATPFVQQMFQWDVPISAKRAGRREEPSIAPKQANLSFLKKSKPLKVSNNPCMARIGRCEHAGGLMETVLARYGITAEELRDAVAELRASRESLSIR